MIRALAFACLSCTLACVPARSLVDAGAPDHDAGARIDAGAFVDAGAPVDAGAFVDGGLPDRDAGVVDAGALVDAGASECASDVGPAFSCAPCSASAPGDVVDLGGVDVLTAPSPGFLARVDGPRTLLFSDSPESPTSAGVLFEAHVAAGPARVYAYHVNATGADAHLSVVVDNEGAQPLTMSIERFAVGAPASDFVGVGQRVTAAWLAATNSAVKSVPAHDKALLLVDSLDGVTVPSGDLMHAIVDVTFSAPARVRVVL
ncbi:MAG TPA: hypothetical protein VGO62_09025, partial [Myxococcota bacterium]